MQWLKFGDKVGHFIAYFVLMSWFGQLYPRFEHRVNSATAFFVMGLALEYFQSIGGVRVASLADAACNGLGIGAGWLSLSTRLNASLAWTDERVAWVLTKT